jgi:uncharacterized protein YccT (UPF0319 family)
MKQLRRCGGILAVVSLALLGGCAAPGPVKLYDGPERKPAELVRISVPEPVEVMAVDGREPPGNFLHNSPDLLLLPGEHVLSLRYVELFQIDAENHEVVRSRQAALRFSGAAGSSYRLTVPPLSGLDAAKKFAASPVFTLVNPQTGEKTQSVAIRSYAEASLIDTLDNAFASSQAQKSQGDSNLDVVKDVWARMTTEERKAFRAWIEQQDGKAP